MTYEEIKDAARWVEQREDPTMSNDPFVRENATPTSRDNGQWDRGRQPHCNQTRPHYKGQMRSSNQNWPTVRAMNLEDLRGNGPDQVDDGNLGDGADDGGVLTRMIMRAQTLHHLPLLPCFHCTSRQPTLHTTMNSRSSGATPVTKQDTSHGTALSASRLLKDKKGLNSKEALNMGGRKPPKQPNGAVESTPPTK